MKLFTSLQKKTLFLGPSASVGVYWPLISVYHLENQLSETGASNLSLRGLLRLLNPTRYCYNRFRALWDLSRYCLELPP